MNNMDLANLWINKNVNRVISELYVVLRSSIISASETGRIFTLANILRWTDEIQPLIKHHKIPIPIFRKTDVFSTKDLTFCIYIYKEFLKEFNRCGGDMKAGNYLNIKNKTKFKTDAYRDSTKKLERQNYI